MIKGYDANRLADVIVRKHPDIRKSADYKAMSDRIFDYTNACDVRERRNWMNHYMTVAIDMERQGCKLLSGNGREQVRREAAVLFLVAYDML